MNGSNSLSSWFESVLVTFLIAMMKLDTKATERSFYLDTWFGRQSHWHREAAATGTTTTSVVLEPCSHLARRGSRGSGMLVLKRLFPLPLLIQPRTPAPGTVLPTFRVNLPSSVSRVPEILSQTHPKECLTGIVHRVY